MCVCVRVKGKKNISYENIEMSFLTPSEGPTVVDHVLLGSNEHTSGIKKTFLIKVSKSRFSHRTKV